MMRALLFKTILSAAVVATSGYHLVRNAGGHALPILAFIVSLTTDQASSNVMLCRYLGKAMGQISVSTAIFVIMVVQCLCLAHQISLCCCSQIFYVGGNANTGRIYVKGILGMSHIFRSPLYLVRIWKASILVLRKCQLLSCIEAANVGIHVNS